MEGLVFPVPDYTPGIHHYINEPFEEFVDTCVDSIPWNQDVEIAESITGVIFDQSFHNYCPNYCTG